LGHLSWASKKGDEMVQTMVRGLHDAVWCVRHLSAAVAGCGRSFLGGSSLGPAGMQRGRSLFTAFPATPAARSESLASAPGWSVVHRSRSHASTQGLRVRAARRRGKAKTLRHSPCGRSRAVTEAEGQAFRTVRARSVSPVRRASFRNVPRATEQNGLERSPGCPSLGHLSWASKKGDEDIASSKAAMK